MTEQNISNNTLANSLSTAENKEKSVKEQKEIVSRMRKEAGASRPKSYSETRDLTSINPKNGNGMIRQNRWKII